MNTFRYEVIESTKRGGSADIFDHVRVFYNLRSSPTFQRISIQSIPESRIDRLPNIHTKIAVMPRYSEMRNSFRLT